MKKEEMQKEQINCSFKKLQKYLTFTFLGLTSDNN